jgi:hypothetical protein
MFVFVQYLGIVPRMGYYRMSPGIMNECVQYLGAMVILLYEYVICTLFIWREDLSFINGEVGGLKSLLK